MPRSRSVVAGVMRSTIELGKATFARIQLRELGIGKLGEPRDRVLGHMAVAGNVVAGHHGEGRNARGAAPLQARRDQAEGGLRRLRLCARRRRCPDAPGRSAGSRARCNSRPRSPSATRCGSSGRRAPRDSPRRRTAEGNRSSTPVTRTVVARGLLLDDRRQPVLRLELRAHVDVRLAHARADERPVVVGAGVEKVVEIDRLMGAMEVADADVDDSRLEIGAPIFRDRDTAPADAPARRGKV